MLNRTGIEWLCEIGLPPPELVSIAGSVGCRNVSTLLEMPAYNPLEYPAWSLLDDPELRREMKGRMADEGVAISLGEGCFIAPGLEVSSHERSLALFAELGAVRVNTVSIDPDRSRTRDQFGQFVELAARFGLETLIEFVPICTIRTLDEAAELIAQTGGNAKILLDVMHFVRAGHQPSDIAKYDPALFGYVQICDGRLTGEPNYMDEAMNMREEPGRGAMPVDQIIGHLRDDLIVSAEVPMLARAKAGVSATERIAGCVRATERILERVSAR